MAVPGRGAAQSSAFRTLDPDLRDTVLHPRPSRPGSATAPRYARQPGRRRQVTHVTAATCSPRRPIEIALYKALIDLGIAKSFEALPYTARCCAQRPVVPPGLPGARRRLGYLSC
ncbi:hypothetical protein ACRAWF_16090 [Streptomyces sp. L7]